MIGVVDSVYLSYFDALVSSEPINLILKSFWVIGGSKLGFWMILGLENRSLKTAQMKLRLKRDIFRLSEIPRMLSR